MSQKTTVLAIAVFLLLIIGMFIFAYLSRQDATVPEVDNDYSSSESIEL